MLVCSISFATQAQTAKINGHITGIGNKPVQFRYARNGKSRVDTVYAKNDRFVYQPKPSDDGTIKVFIQNPRWFSCWYEPGDLNISGSIEKPYKLVLKGGTENNTLNLYNTTIEWFYDDLMAGKSDSVRSKLEKEQQLKTLDFIKQNPASRTAADLLYWQTMYDDSKIDMYEKLLAGFTPMIRQSPQGLKLAERIEIIKNQPMPGKAAPLFKLVNTKGDSVALNSFRGKYVLLDFWGHWCGPCITAFPSLKKLQTQYAGKMQFVGIAAEYADDKEKWLKAIETHKADWVQLSELKGDKGAVNTTYNIVAFPTYFVLDENGIVVGKANSLATIETLLASLEDLK